MSARILVVDDMQINLRLMEVRLNEEYFEVLTASSGPEALAICSRQNIDLVLLDVMMPDMDGYEVCRRLKADPSTHHIPVVLITALDQPTDRVRGLEAGADDFLIKPVRDLPLFSRVRGLTRLKLLTDELRVRADATVSVIARSDMLEQLANKGTEGSILIMDEDPRSGERTRHLLRSEHRVQTAVSYDASVLAAGGFDLVIVDFAARSFDPLRLCSQIRSNEATRQTPVLAIANVNDEERMARAVELGANDYLVRPIDRNELLARARTQIKRRRYDDSLRQSLRESIELAVIDPLTGLNNRRFLQTYLTKGIERSRIENKPLSILLADIDHFKRINDGWGHDVGDEILRQFASRVRDSIRGSDLACRYGGEEFVILMPEADGADAATIAERLRHMVSERAFAVEGEEMSITVSVGSATLNADDDEDTLLKRADRGLYAAKREGRNRVISLAA